jgi:hypothetical protein
MRGVIWGVAFLVTALVASFFLGPVLALPVAGALGATIVGLRRSEALAGGRRLPRERAAASAGLLAGLGVVFAKVLVANPSDNAYLWIAMLGVLLGAVAVPFALAALAPAGPLRGGLARLGIGLVWVVGGPGALLLLVGALLSLLSSPRGVPGAVVDDRVAVNHVVGCVALLGLVWLVGYYWPRRSRARRAG